MAKKIETLSSLEKKTSLIASGIPEELNKEKEALDKLVNDTIITTTKKLGAKASNGSVVNYFNELNFGKVFSNLYAEKDSEKLSNFKASNEDRVNKKNLENTNKFKDFMENSKISEINNLLASDSSRQMLFNNYEAIFTHIPECAQALEVIKDNIMSPDDFTKIIFNMIYDSNDLDLKDKVENLLEGIRDKYGIEELSEEIIEKTLLYGEQYLAVLPMDEQLNRMMSKLDPSSSGMSLIESSHLMDKDYCNPILTENEIIITDSEKNILNEVFSDDINENPEEFIAKLINENIQIGSKNELLLERITADRSASEEFESDLQSEISKKNNNRKDSKIDYTKNFIRLNGSSLKLLDCRKIVELKIENIVYGYYYFEDGGNPIPSASYLGPSTKRQASPVLDISSNNTVSTTTQTTYNPSTSGTAETRFNISQDKLEVITQIFLKNISRKLNKEFLKYNKQFKDFLYELIKQEYIVKNQIKLTFLFPEEVVAFKFPAVYRKILFFAKLYLSTLTNDLLIKLGRSHDKRVFYVNVGIDDDYEQAISQTIQDIKTKEYKMDDLKDINTILNLTPGRFDDYFLPSLNGDKPVDIETLPGMDSNLSSEFLEFLKASMINGCDGVPPSYIDATKELEFARSLSGQNSNFVRSIIRRQKKITPAFQQLMVKLLKNEFKYNNTENSEFINEIDFDKIKVSFPSPNSLNYSNLSEQIAVVDGNAEFISNILVPQSLTENAEDERLKLKAMVVKDMLPGIDWEKYQEFKDKIDIEKVKDDITNKVKNPSDGFPSEDQF